MLNQIVLTGNLGDDPVIHYSGNTGDPVANFDLAFYCGKDRDGNKRTGWIRCVCFKKTAEITESHLQKGARIAVVGSLDENVWTNDDNQTRKKDRLVVVTVKY
jgi:single-strand DNA-binding protein